MNVYARGANRDGVIAEAHLPVLRSRMPAIFGPDCLRVHGGVNSRFEPEECAGVLIAGGRLGESPEDVEQALNYTRAMRWFSDSTIGISVGVAEEFSPEGWGQHLSAIDSLKLLAVRDVESAHILRRAGVHTPVLTCADLAYLVPVNPRLKRTTTGRPVLGVVGEDMDEMIAKVISGLESDFEIRYVSAADFADIDVCLTSKLQGVILSVLHRIPFAAIPAYGEPIDRECRALKYPFIADARSAWSERDSLRAILENAKPLRLRLAHRNLELMQGMAGVPQKSDRIESGKETLVVWAAPDQYWEEAESLFAEIHSDFDCLVPSDSRVSPSRTRRRMAIPSGSLMHWGMFPEDLRRQIENRYDNAIVCHAFPANKDHLADIASHTGRHGWEFRLWTHSCESYS